MFRSLTRRSVGMILSPIHQHYPHLRFSEFINSRVGNDIYQNMEDEALAILCTISTLAELGHLEDILAILPPDNKSIILKGALVQHLQPVETLLQAGWCPRKVAEIYSDIGPLSLYYVTTLTRDYQVGNLASCTTSKCGVSKVDSETYRTSHTCIGCAHIQST